MAEYIDIDKAVLVADIRGRELKTTVRHILGMNKGVYDTEDVQPVRHGRWIMNDQSTPVCSRCGNVVAFVSHPDRKWDFGHYCPNCGALMNMEDTDGETTD